MNLDEVARRAVEAAADAGATAVIFVLDFSFGALLFFLPLYFQELLGYSPTEVGLLLRVAADGSISRMVVSGRVLFGERVREALMRHLEKDLGPLALPRLPADPTPFTIVEYFPDPDRSGFHDPRHHAVSLAYVVPVDGDCQPTQEALDLAWFTPDEAASLAVRAQMTGGHDRLLRLALAHVGELP